MTFGSHHVVVLGASPNPSRFSNRAVKLLNSRGYRVTPVHPSADTVEHLKVVRDLDAVPRPVHTLTLYLRPEHLALIQAEILALGAQRVIFNPGTEYPTLEARLRSSGTVVIRGCTLIMLTDGSF